MVPFTAKNNNSFTNIESRHDYLFEKVKIMRICDLLKLYNDGKVKVADFQIGGKKATAYIGTDESKHGYSHVHIELDNEQTVFKIQTGDKIIGNLNGFQENEVKKWVLGHRRMLTRQWNKHSGGRKIEFTRYSKRKKNYRSRKGHKNDMAWILYIARIIAKNGGLYGARIP